MPEAETRETRKSDVGCSGLQFFHARNGLVASGQAKAQMPNVAGEWSVGRPPAVGQLEGLIRSIPMAVFRLTHSVVQPIAMVRADLGYTYVPSLPTITILQGTREKPQASGFLQARSGRWFEGELASSGDCWMHLSLEESEDGSTLSGSARINTKISTRGCRSSLAKDVKKGEPFEYALIRLK